MNIKNHFKRNLTLATMTILSTSCVNPLMKEVKWYKEAVAVHETTESLLLGISMACTALWLIVVFFHYVIHDLTDPGSYSYYSPREDVFANILLYIMIFMNFCLLLCLIIF